MVNVKPDLGCCEKECLPNCCKDCPKCPDCYDLNEHRLRDILYALDMRIAELTEAYICEQNWGYSKEKNPWEEIDTLNTLRPVVSDYEKATRFGLDVCLCPHEINAIIEKILCRVSLSCCNDEHRCDLIIDESNLHNWILSNPTCVAYEKWERCLYDIMPTCG